MKYTQYTQCVRIEDKHYPSWAPSPNTVVALAALATLLAGGVLLPWIAVPLIGLVLAYCWWWINDRLICLGGEVCAIGVLGITEPPSQKSGFGAFDTDFSINLLLAPHHLQELPGDYPASVPPPPAGVNTKDYFDKELKKALHRQIADDGMQGRLIKEQTTTSSEGWGFEGVFSTIGSQQAPIVYQNQPYLHCEFEGGGMYRLQEALKAALPFAAAAAVACAIPFFGWIVCAVLGAIAAVITIVGVVEALGDVGKPSVLDPTTGATTTELDNGYDILFVSGTWVYDSLHEGWNEIHPIKDCQLVATASYLPGDKIDWERAIGDYMVAHGHWSYEGSDPKTRKLIKTSGPPAPTDWTDWVQSWCDGLRTASHPLTVDNQSRPENKWKIHPVVDGCKPAPSGPPPDPGPH